MVYSAHSEASKKSTVFIPARPAMSQGKITKIVENAHYHIWTDALHGRALARQAQNRWDKGTYVRWVIMTAWTAFEMACEDGLEKPGIGRSFRRNLDNAI